MAQKAPERNIITDTLVVEKTGKPIEHWFTNLDKKGAAGMSHTQIFALVSSTDGLAPLGEWNHNLLTTSYEWSRGLKERGQKGKEFEISVSKTVNVPLPLLYSNFNDAALRKKWLKEKIVIRKATENKSMRVTWGDNTTSLSIDFYEKGSDKAQVVIQHQKIPDSKMANAMKLFWAKALNGLKEKLEK